MNINPGDNRNPAMNVQTYLFFKGNCSEALDFYRGVFGISVECVITYGQGPPELMPSGWSEKIFHSTAKFGGTLVNMADSIEEDRAKFGGFALLAHMDSDCEAERVFDALKTDGAVSVPLEPTFWASRYGIVTDQFGVTWKVQSSSAAI
jgi:PhnB protein